MLNIIIGKNSNLSKALSKELINTILIKTSDIVKDLEKITFAKYKNINIIFNQFQISTKLNILENPIDYIQRSILSTSEVLTYIKINHIKINKIIYTSSSSVYGNNIASSEIDKINPLNLHASLKTANEQLIIKFCIDNKIDYSIARIFNMYGGDDNFSIISKILNIYNNNNTLSIINNGESIRDYIYILDVVYSYKNILNHKNIPIINIGTSSGKSILYILEYLRKKGIEIKTTNIEKNELKISISQNDLLLKILGKYSFTNVEEYLCNTIQKMKEL